MSLVDQILRQLIKRSHMVVGHAAHILSADFNVNGHTRIIALCKGCEIGVRALDAKDDASRNVVFVT